MMLRVRNPKDFWAGTLHALLGTTALLIANDYELGTGARMGPGYFPTVLSGLLILLGAFSIARSLYVDGSPIGRIAFKPLGLITSSTVVFSYLLPRVGLPVALFALIIVSAAASSRFRFDVRAGLGLVALITFCTLLFVIALGIPLPLYGTWFSAD